MMNAWLLNALSFSTGKLHAPVNSYVVDSARPEPSHNHDLQNNWFEQVKPRLATRKRRLLHLLWHETRRTWHDLSSEQQTAIQALGWAPPRPVTSNNAKNGSGEDFLFYCRYLCVRVDRWLSPNNQKVEAWSNEKSPFRGKCSEEAMVARMADLKSDHKYWGALVREYDFFRYPEQLKQMQLSELGNYLERNIYRKMHQRWAKVPWHGGRTAGDINTEWDDERYDWLADDYASHVNKLFWYLLKWVDCRLDDWYEACSDEVEAVTVRGVPWFANSGQSSKIKIAQPWVGAGDADFDDVQGGLENMEKVFEILSGRSSD